MPEADAKGRLTHDWIVADWADKMATILESMADERPTVEEQDSAAGANQPAGDALIWEQSFALSEKPLIWVATPQDAVNQIGERTLRSSGVDTIEATESRNTFLEVLSQSLSALGQSISGKLECDGAATTGGPVDQFPPDLQWLSVTMEFADKKLEPIWIGCDEHVLALLGAQPVEQEPEEAPSAREIDSIKSRSALDPLAGPQSKTFDLLLDVSLSVSVSFGRTFLPIREVLKLTTGSIVELDRLVNEPVEIIVNNCVIARGEVVVVEGNYGVKINQIASRDDRLKTGSTAAEAQHALLNT